MGLVERKTSTQYTDAERRRHRRYGIILDLRWKVLRRRKVIHFGTGASVDFSRGGILFDAGRTLPLGYNVELSIAWPALLDNVAPMQLVVSGRVVRADGGQTAILMNQHEFRTAGLSRRDAAAPSPFPRLLARGGSAGAFGTLQ